MVSVRTLAVDILLKSDQRFVDDLLGDVTEPLDRRDRALLTNLVYGATRHRMTLDALITRAAGRPQVDALVVAILRIALYQVIYLTRIPAHAAVNEAVEEAKRRAPRAGGFVNAVLRKALRDIEGPYGLPRPGLPPIGLKSALWGKDPVERLSIAYSHPDWLIRRWLGHGWSAARVEAICAANNETPVITLAPNRDIDALKILTDAGIEAESRPSGLIAARATGDLARLPEIRSGAIRVQDEVAARVGPLMAPKKGEMLLDLCAAPGGKSAHLLSLGEARVVSVDVSIEKVDRIRRSAPAASIVIADARRAPFRRAFDGILADVPCSNTAVLGRRVDARWRLKPGDIDRLIPLQRAILESAVALVRPGGRIVYSTCSLEPEENEARVKELVQRHPGPTLRSDPSAGVGGGFAQVLNFGAN